MDNGLVLTHGTLLQVVKLRVAPPAKRTVCYVAILSLERKLKVLLTNSAQSSVVTRRAVTITTKGPMVSITQCFTTRLVDIQAVLSEDRPAGS